MKRAFTLIELLIVVAIIAVLAAIAVPNFLEAQVRSKTARTHTDMAVTAAALRAYCSDYRRYPPNNPDLLEFAVACTTVDDATTIPTPAHSKMSWNRADNQFDFRPANRRSHTGTYRISFPLISASGDDLYLLTTPIRYFTNALMVDPFHDLKGSYISYLNINDVASSAPVEAEFELTPPGARYWLFSYGPDGDSAGAKDAKNPIRDPLTPYDPTNGTVSMGNLYHFGK